MKYGGEDAAITTFYAGTGYLNLIAVPETGNGQGGKG